MDRDLCSACADSALVEDKARLGDVPAHGRVDDLADELIVPARRVIVLLAAEVLGLGVLAGDVESHDSFCLIVQLFSGSNTDGVPSYPTALNG